MMNELYIREQTWKCDQATWQRQATSETSVAKAPKGILRILSLLTAALVK